MIHRGQDGSIPRTNTVALRLHEMAKARRKNDANRCRRIHTPTRSPIPPITGATR
jgi:hypothetical protein